MRATHPDVPSVPEALQRYDIEQAIEQAAFMLSEVQLEPTSAFKQAASDAGVPWGEPMAQFVSYARERFGLK